MIESRYWKEDLLAHAKRLNPCQKPKRWSERQVVNFEKEIMISFFMVRALLERRKLSKKVQSQTIQVTKYPWNRKHITILNFAHVNDLYDFEQGVDTSVTINFISNQFVHARAIYATRDETRNWSHVLLCSDFEQKKSIYLTSVSEIQRIFRLVASDEITDARLIFDSKVGDYRYITD